MGLLCTGTNEGTILMGIPHEVTIPKLTDRIKHVSSLDTELCVGYIV